VTLESYNSRRRASGLIGSGSLWPRADAYVISAQKVECPPGDELGSVYPHLVAMMPGVTQIPSITLSCLFREYVVDPGFPFRLTPMSFALRVTNSP